MDRVAQIIQAESDADAWDTQAEDAKTAASLLRWQAAELIAAELAEGKSQRVLAREMTAAGRKTSQTHVCHASKAWQLFGDCLGNQRPPFNEAYHSPEVRKPNRVRASREGSGQPSTPPVTETESSGENDPGESKNDGSDTGDPPRIGDIVDALTLVANGTERQQSAAMIQVFGANRDVFKVFVKALKVAADTIGA